jgi:hypothetical protein
MGAGSLSGPAKRSSPANLPTGLRPAAAKKLGVSDTWFYFPLFFTIHFIFEIFQDKHYSTSRNQNRSERDQLNRLGAPQRDQLWLCLLNWRGQNTPKTGNADTAAKRERLHRAKRKLRERQRRLTTNTLHCFVHTTQAPHTLTTSSMQAHGHEHTNAAPSIGLHACENSAPISQRSRQMSTEWAALQETG